MIFLDTSAIYALADKDDDMHDSAVTAFNRAQHSSESMLTHSYVLVESAALLQRRLGISTALAFLNEAERFIVHWVTHETHLEAVGYLAENGSSKLSLVDVVSFLVMRREGVSEFLGYDGHFTEAGFRQFSGAD